jgi:asparagine synthase (glutamine-hydrolysing)
MCGIVGVLSRNPDRDVKLETAMRQLQHRGPDDRGFWSDERHIHLGHTRLSILDLSPLGHQPMSYRDGRFWITFNGEIYNYLELRQELITLGHRFVSQTDTEVLLAAYSQWGTSCLEKLRGMFAFGIWDGETRTLFLARDRVGEKPLYYWTDGNTLYFASELKALMTLLPQIPELDPVAIDLYFHYLFVPEPRTPLVGVSKLSAGHYMLIDCESFEIEPRRYWRIEQIEAIEGEPIELIRQELNRSIELTLRSDVPVGVALSGGIDSGAIAALAAHQYKDTLQAFSIGYPGRPAYDERDQAKELAASLGVPLFDIELRTEDLVDFFPDLVAATDDPIADIAAYGHYAVTKLAADKGVKVMLTGIGGDELFWSYFTEQVQLTELKQQFLQNSTIPPWASNSLEHIVSYPLYQRLALSRKVPKALSSLLGRGLEISKLSMQYPQQAVFYDRCFEFQEAHKYGGKLYTQQFAAKIPVRNPYHLFEFDVSDCQDIPIQICQLVFETWLVSECLSLGDRVSMASSVETRLPLLDYKLVELVIGLRKLQPDHNLGHKFWLKSALKGILSDEVLNRPKRGFQPPTYEWMEALINKYRSWLEMGYLVEFNIISADYLRNIINAFERNRQHTWMLYTLLNLETWYRKVVVQES